MIARLSASALPFAQMIETPMRSIFAPLARFAAIVMLAGGLAACKSELYSSLPERDANEMVSVLAQSGITASREAMKGGNFSVSVERDDTTRALAALNQRGLPRQQFETLGTVFDAKKMVSTPFEEKARFMYAINQELANSLTQISGVVSARVHVMMPEAAPLERNKQAPRASVFIYHLPEASLAPYLPIIKNLVVNSVNGLNYEDVTVAFFPSKPSVDVKAGRAAFLPGANQIVFIVLGVVLLGMFLKRRAIGRYLDRTLAHA